MRHRVLVRSIASVVFLAVLVAVAIVGCNDKDPVVVVPPEDPIVVSNQIPVVYPPLVVATSLTTRSPVTIDVRYRVQGCDASGASTGVTGAFDPDGDLLEYRFGCRWSVFEKGGDERINGRWVTFPTETNPNGVTEQRAIVELWVGWVETTPLMPVSPQSCEPAQAAIFTYEVRDPSGTVVIHKQLLGSPG